MTCATYVGRVGALAVALGVGAGLFTGTGVAWADPDESSGSSSAESSQAESSHAESTTPEPTGDGAESGATGSADTDGPTSSVNGVPVSADDSDEDSDEVGPEPDETGIAEPKPKLQRKKLASQAPEPGVREIDTTQVATRTSSASVQSRAADPEPTDSEPTDPEPADPEPEPATQQRLSLTTAATEPAVPGLRAWPTAFDPTTAVSYLTGLVTSVVSAVLNPFAAGLPAGPVEPPTVWTLLAWVRRELFNESPTITYDPVLNSQTVNSDGDVVVTGDIGADDADADPRTYTVIGRPLNGGTVSVDVDGGFTYRPTNAMAAVGGWDQFTVVVDDAAAGLHVHGPLGLLQFVPILGDFLNPGAGHRVAKTVTVTVAPTAGVDLSFPDGFHWGVAHAGFQAEGGPGSPVDPNSDWYRWVHDPINQLLGLTRGVPEDGPGAYVRYDEDAQLARDELGMNTFRMSIEWSRIFPNSTAAIDISDEGGVISLADLQAMDELADEAEVAHYRDVLASLRAHGLEPMVTVSHFSLPVWVNDPIAARPLIQLGLPAPAAGWLSETTPVEFEKYAAYLAWKYGDQVDNWATINEPFPPVLTQYFAIPGVVPAWPPGVIRPDLASTFLVNEAKGHVAAYDAIHAWDADAFVGFTNNMIPARPANPTSELDVQAADAWNLFYNNWFPQAVVNGWVDANFDGVQTPDEIHPDFADKIDFLGVQYYGSQPMTGFGVAPVPGFPFLRGIPIRCEAASATCSDFNQPIDPGGFREVLEVAASYGKPVWVTENGIADDEDTKRPGYLVNHIAVVQDLVAHGTDIRGYTYWSFVDNLEWSEGYHLQFGLYGSDPTTPELERTPKPASIAAISAITGSNGLPLFLLGQYAPSL
ncbi:family 1 glycosylhydrolase [Mycolicibacterium arenosum]|uniref:Family 1 glycosylhydrolase n=1 Tax=Mycolicibacterium arenosum TaxID=2952157 RepID=A0ABT1M016_9MYCO|nr:family 1 glycosylhydrolase [Mycolicibacterium sp. CAU 1645]MCP9271604.1 family 1 glycosylhydrolase [Mycolicibacterium sp. CAU 1645]